MNRSGARTSLLVLIALIGLGAAACGGARYWSVTVGTALPAPWGAVTISTAVPMGYGW
jgi:hypothetical protein